MGFKSVRLFIRARWILLQIMAVSRLPLFLPWLRWNIVFPHGSNSTIYLLRKQLGCKIFIALHTVGRSKMQYRFWAFRKKEDIELPGKRICTLAFPTFLFPV